MTQHINHSVETTGYPKWRSGWISGDWDAMQKELKASAEASYNQARWAWLWVSLIMIVGGCLRFYGLNVQSLWQDELSGWYRSSFSTLHEVWVKGILTDNHPPAMHFILYVVQQLFGDSPVTLRIPSAIAGTLIIPLIYLVGKEMYSRLEGGIAAVLVMLFYTPIYYSQEARSNIVLVLFTLASTLFWWQMMAAFTQGNKPSKKIIAGYIITTIISVFLHHFGVIFAFLLALWGGIRLLGRWQSLLYFACVYLAIAILYTPWLPAALIQFQTPGESFTWAQAEWMDPPFFDVVVRVLQFFYSNSHFYEGSDPLLALVLMFFALALIAEIVTTVRHRHTSEWQSARHSPTLFAFFILVGSFGFAYLVSLKVFLIFSDRNLIIALPAAYLLLARSITRIAEWLGRRQGVALFLTSALALVLCYQFFVVMDYYQRPVKEQFREAVAYIIQNEDKYPNAVIIGGNSVQQKEYVNYYMRHLGSTRKLNSTAGREKDIEKVSELLKSKEPRYIWFISVHKSPSKEFVKFIDGVGDLLDKQRFIDASVRVYAFDPEKLK